MKVLIGASDIDLVVARDWMLLLGNRAFFKDLETKLELWEAVWGMCYIFVEIALPQGSRVTRPHNQIDILICFSGRVAHCEMKLFRSRQTMDLGELHGQVKGQIKWLEGLLLDGRFNIKCLKTFLFFPYLNLNEITKVGQDLINIHYAHHIWPTGAHSSLEKHADNQGRPLYLVKALENRLRNSQTIIPKGQTGVQEFFHKIITQSGGRLRQFRNFRELETWLPLVPPIGPVPPSWYVKELRSQKFIEANKTLCETRIVELVGAPGIGKSTMAEELIWASGNEFRSLYLSERHSSHDICSEINDVLGGGPAGAMGEETLLQHLVKKPYVFWIKGYDSSSATALGEVLHEVSSITKAVKEVRARWIIESDSPLKGLEKFRHEVGPLDDRSVIRILAKVEPGNPRHDPEVVARLAQGNPGRALRLWRSQQPASEKIAEESADEFEWFYRQLSDDQQRILSILCMAALNSPMGITAHGLELWSRAIYKKVHPDRLLSDVHNTVVSLVDRLADSQLARVVRLDRDTFGGLLDEILPQDLSITVLSDVPPGLIDRALSPLTDEQKEEYRKEFGNFLSQAAETNTLTYVTLGLYLGDLEPFFRSSFRLTHLQRIVSWIHRTQWQCTSARHRFLLKALRLLVRPAADPTIDVEEETAPAQLGDEVQKYAYEVVKARAFVGRKLDAAFKLPAWLEKVQQCEDSALQAEMYAYTVMSLQRGNRPEKSQETWNILKGLPDKYDANSTAHCRIVYETLAFLNRARQREAVLHDEEAHAEIRRLSRELLEIGLRMENLQLISDALFYFTWSQVFRKAQTSYSEVLGYRAVLRFAEDAQEKTVRRLQILLSQGSIHRHFCEGEELAWDEFRQHLEDGWECYSRSLKSALAIDHVLHTLNAVSFMVDFCMKALRFADNRAAIDLVIEKIEEALANAQLVGDRMAPLIRGSEEKNILLTIKRSSAVLFYATTVSDLNEESGGLLKLRFKESVDLALAAIDAARDPWVRKRLTKEMDGHLKALCGAITFGKQFHKEHNRAVTKMLDRDVERLLNGTRAFLGGEVSGPWKNLMESRRH